MTGIVGTAGHIDHGKSTLIRALTGEETDRLPEEQRRGISIDLGFSHLEDDDVRLGIVDVPGHEDFIRNMLAGATGIDVLLLVVAADEGVMPQTREHTAIAELLGVERAVVALTKVDLVDDEWLGLVHDDLADFLAGTRFAGAQVIPTSAVTGQGLAEVRRTLVHASTGPRGRRDDLFRLPIDRVFTVRGTGTVVTGTVWSGRLERESGVRLLPDGPEARVRGIQVHGRDVDAVEAGERAAVALAGVDRDDVDRGMSVVADPGWEPSSILTVRLRVIPGPGWSIEQRQRVRVHLGTAEVMARAVVLDGQGLGPGEEGWVQLRLERPLLARRGDRLVIRSYSPVTTIGGGSVVEPIAPRRSDLTPADRSRLERLDAAEPDEGLDALLDSAGGEGVAIPRLSVLLGTTPGRVEEALRTDRALVVGDRAYGGAALTGTRDRLLEAVQHHHRKHPLRNGVDPELVRRAAGPADPELIAHALATLEEDGSLERRGGRLARVGWSPVLTSAQEGLRERVLAALRDAGLASPRLEELAALVGEPEPGELRDLLQLMEEEDRVVRIEHDLFVERSVLDTTIRDIRSRLGGREGLSPGDFREVLDVSRRHLMPLLGYLDRQGVTVRGHEGRTVVTD